MSSNRPIGIFDSGVGGLTVLKEVLDVLPNENILYLGDVARVPYGGRSKEVITKFALEMASFLLKRQVKALVVACNTISANCLEELRNFSPVPVVDVISPTVNVAAETTKNLKIAVAGTRSTIHSGVYERTIKIIQPEISVYSIACPLFTSFVEEGQIAGIAIESVAKQYLGSLSDADTLILGCTHYPVLMDVICQTVGSKVQVISSGNPTAIKLKELLTSTNMLNNQSKKIQMLYVTDIGTNTSSLAENIFNNQNKVKLEKVSLDD